MRRASFLMCRPTFYGVEYVINPWMDLRRQPNRRRALRQWQSLRRTLREQLGATVHCCRARPGLPDMTFTANAGLARGKIFIPSRFRYPERAGEAPHFIRWFRARGYRVRPLPTGHSFEGAGDALLMGDRLFAGYRFRSDIRTHVEVGKTLGIRVLSLELINPYFYHLDTCFMPMSEELAIYYPGAFDRYGQRVIRENVADLLPVRHEEAYQFACNAVPVGKKAVISAPCRSLAGELERRGFAVFPMDLSEFRKAGGAARCLALRLA
jgi:N-dimethylarginine dimethylaminohydrolase